MKIFAIILLFLPLWLEAQEKNLTPDEAAQYMDEADPFTFITHYIFEGEELYGYYAKREDGEVLVEGNNLYRVEGVKQFMVGSYGIIEFDIEKVSLDEINLLRNAIIAKYKLGADFAQLATEYGEDRSPDAAAIELSEDFMMPEMREACQRHSPGQIFTVDAPAMNRYYIMVENHEPVKKKAVVVQHKVYEEE